MSRFKKLTESIVASTGALASVSLAQQAVSAQTALADQTAIGIGLGVGGDSGNGGDGGNGGNGGDGGDGGFASVHDIANANSDASSSVILDNITTGDAIGHSVVVDAAYASDPVVVSVAGSFPDTGVDVFAPGGSAQSGTTGGNGLIADASGGDGGDGGNGGDGGDSGDGGNGNGLGAAQNNFNLAFVS
jgi:hypothetical protein